MEIVNQTCYNTEDIAELWNRTKATYNKVVSSTNGWWARRYNWEDPDTLVVGYYKSPYTDADPGVASFTSERSSPVTRLGIAKKGDLPWGSCLIALAKAGDSDATGIPQVVVKQIVRSMMVLAGAYQYAHTLPSVEGEAQDNRCYTNYGSEESGAFDWIKDFVVRYNNRAKRGSRKAAARARKKGNLKRLRDQISEIEANVVQQQRIIESQIALKADLEQELSSLQAAVTAAEEEINKET